MAIQILRRIGGAAAAPASLVVGQMALDFPASGLDADEGALYAGDGTDVFTMVSAARQVELAGDQTISGNKSISIANLKITGGANNDIISTDGAGNLTFTTAPGGGLLAVATDGTLEGDGTSGDPLSVLHLQTEREITLQAAPPAANGAKTEISIIPAEFDGSADAIMTGFAITTLDDGTY